MKKFLLLIICAFGIINCSRLDLAVNWADTYIASQVDKYFDLTSQQNKDLKKSLKEDLGRIRKEKFPEWANTLRDFEREIGNDSLTPEKYATYYRKTLEAAKTVQPYFTDTAVEMIGTASSGQLNHFEEAVREKNIEDKEKIQDREKARDKSRKNYLRWITMWVDSLTKDQNQLLNTHLNEHPFPRDLQIKNRAFAMTKFREAQKTPESLKTFVRDYYNNKRQYDSPEYQQALAGFQTELEKFSYKFLQSLNNKQKQRLRENLKEKANTLDKLSLKD